MIVALDVGYTRAATGIENGRCGVVAFAGWDSATAAHELTVDVNDVRPYESGRLFERELPCLMAGLESLQAALGVLDLDAVLVDGNVRLNRANHPGLGLHLWEYLREIVPVIGVAKNPFSGLDAVEILRGASKKPLFVTAVGIEEDTAAGLVRDMAGGFRLPTLIRRADQLARS